jgi:cobalamin biosynthetic protein CobC
MDGGSMSPFERLSQHGGRLCVARDAFPDAPRPWIDLSTGINPHAYRAPASTARERAQLPDPARLAQLERIAGEAFRVRDVRNIIATPGTELALRLLPSALGAKRCAVATPTYSSHADAWRRSGAVVDELPLTAIESSLPHDGVVIVNPNNPDGALLTRSQILELHDRRAAKGRWLVIDEAFIDVEPDQSICDVAGTARAPQLVALRSFGKFYGLAGVRLGFAIGAPAVIERIRDLIGEWPLSVDALAAGLAAYADLAWAHDMRTRLRSDAQRLDALLTQGGLSVIGGTTLFRLTRHGDAQRLLRHLLSAGILVRPFAHDATLLRFGLPGSGTAWRRLAKALKSS